MILYRIVSTTQNKKIFSFLDIKFKQSTKDIPFKNFYRLIISTYFHIDNIRLY